MLLHLIIIPSLDVITLYCYADTVLYFKKTIKGNFAIFFFAYFKVILEAFIFNKVQSQYRFNKHPIAPKRAKFSNIELCNCLIFNFRFFFALVIFCMLLAYLFFFFILLVIFCMLLAYLFFFFILQVVLLCTQSLLANYGWGK